MFLHIPYIHLDVLYGTSTQNHFEGSSLLQVTELMHSFNETRNMPVKAEILKAID